MSSPDAPENKVTQEVEIESQQNAPDTLTKQMKVEAAAENNFNFVIHEAPVIYESKSKTQEFVYSQ